MASRFSSRHGLSALNRPITARAEAPEQLRNAIVHFAAERALTPREIRDVVLGVVGLPPEPQMWHNPDYVIQECQRHLTSAEWFESYDVAEALHEAIAQRDPRAAEQYAERLNRLLLRLGIGWKLQDGAVQARGSESFEVQASRANEQLAEAGLSLAASEIHEALADLSRRPHPDLTGAIQHAVAALECVAREVTKRRSLTLGDIIKREADLFPQPLDVAFAKVWGFASERARHIREGGTLDREETEFVVSLAAAAATYLVQKASQTDA